jgi:hypothetical protein
MDHEDPAIKAQAERSRNCRHERLQFGSGGFYIFCMDCRGTWVAKRGWGPDNIIDYDRAHNLVSTFDVRVVEPKKCP